MKHRIKTALLLGALLGAGVHGQALATTTKKPAEQAAKKSVAQTAKNAPVNSGKKTLAAKPSTAKQAAAKPVIKAAKADSCLQRCTAQGYASGQHAGH